MFITITGLLGSGKSTVCGILKEQYGFEIFTTGVILRKMAAEHNMTTLEYNAYLIENTGNADAVIDGASRRIAEEKEGQDVVFDSRMAWFFVPNSVKVFLSVDSKEAAKRVMAGQARENEAYSSVEEAESALIERRADEVKRFKMLYDADCENMDNYDIVIDTTSITPQEVANTIMNYCKTKLSN